MKKQLFLLFALPMLWGLIGCAEEEPVVTPSPYPNPGPETEYQELGCMTFEPRIFILGGISENGVMEEEGLKYSLLWFYNDCGDYVINEPGESAYVRLVTEDTQEVNDDTKSKILSLDKEVYQVGDDGWAKLVYTLDEEGNATGNIHPVEGWLKEYDHVALLDIVIPQGGYYLFHFELYDPLTGHYYTSPRKYCLYLEIISEEPNGEISYYVHISYNR